MDPPHKRSVPPTDPFSRKGILKYRSMNHRCLVQLSDQTYKWFDEEDVDILSPKEPDTLSEQPDSQIILQNNIECLIKPSVSIQTKSYVDKIRPQVIDETMTQNLSNTKQIQILLSKKDSSFRGNQYLLNRMWRHKIQRNREETVKRMTSNHRFQKKKKRVQIEEIQQQMIEDGCIFSYFFDPLPENYEKILKGEDQSHDSISNSSSEDTNSIENSINQWCINHMELWDLIRYFSFYSSFKVSPLTNINLFPLSDLFPELFKNFLVKKENQEYYVLNYQITSTKKENTIEIHHKKSLESDLETRKSSDLSSFPSTSQSSPKTLSLNQKNSNLIEADLNTPHVSLKSYYDPQSHQLLVLRDPQTFSNSKEQKKRSEIFKSKENLISLLSFNSSSSIIHSIYIPYSFSSTLSFFTAFNSMYSSHSGELTKGFALLKGLYFHYHIQKHSILIGQLNIEQKKQFDSLLNFTTYHNNTLFDCDLSSQSLDSTIQSHCLRIYYSDHQWYIQQIQPNIQLYVNHQKITDFKQSTPLPSPSLISINHHIRFYFLLARLNPSY